MAVASGDDESSVKSLASKEDILLHIFRQGKSGGLDGLWKRLSPELRNDQNLELAAIENHFVNYTDLIPPLNDDKDFLLQVVQQRPDMWYGLPDCFRQDPDFAFATKLEIAPQLVRHLFNAVPSLRGDRHFWMKIYKANAETDDDKIRDEFFSNGRIVPTEELLADREFMIDACQFDDIYF